MDKHLNDGRVNSIIGTALGFGFVTPKQIPFAGAILFFCLPFIFMNPFQGVFLFLGIYGLFWALTGNDPSEFFERLKKPKKYITEEIEVDFDRAGIPQAKRTGKMKTTYKVRGKAKQFHHIEKKFLFKTYGEIQLDGRDVGFYLLQRGTQVMFIFGWKVEGLDPAMTAEQAESNLSAITDALNQIPSDIDIKTYQDVGTAFEEYLRLQYGVYSDELDRLSQEIIKSRAQRG